MELIDEIVTIAYELLGADFIAVCVVVALPLDFCFICHSVKLALLLLCCFRYLVDLNSQEMYVYMDQTEG